MKKIEELLQEYKKGEISQEEILAVLRQQPFQDIGIAKLDNHRELRSGFPEVVFGMHKTADQIGSIVRAMLEQHDRDILVTKTQKYVYQTLQDIPGIRWQDDAKMIHIERTEKHMSEDFAVVLTGGTSDIPVAREAVITLQAMECSVREIYDVGVCGVHRLLHFIEELQRAKVIIVAAGMEGALCSVAAGLVACPVIGLPTSVGYGASFEGVAALLSMLNSCANRVSVVNIDNGFGAGCIAASIIRNDQ